MRVSEVEKRIIRENIVQVFGEEVTVYLFGSRVDDRKRGGDIDLLVLAHGSNAELFEKKLIVLGGIQRELGERKIDMITWDEHSQKSEPAIVREALSTGVLL